MVHLRTSGETLAGQQRRRTETPQSRLDLSPVSASALKRARIRREREYVRVIVGAIVFTSRCFDLATLPPWRCVARGHLS